LWIAAWVSSNDTQGFEGIASFSGPPVAGATQDLVTLYEGFGWLSGETHQAGTSGPVGSQTQNQAGVWQHLIWCETGTTSREQFVNGVSTGTNANNLAGALSLDRLLLFLGWPVPPATRLIAEVIFGTGKPTPAQALALAQGRNPLSLGLNILAYYPLRGSLTDLGPNNYAMTQVGTFTPTWVSSRPVVDAPPGVSAARRPRITVFA
jgi:hypothetical protein